MMVFRAQSARSSSSSARSPSNICFFFSSRRRHTRCSRDWSSDVCSSDLFVDEKRIGFFSAWENSLAVLVGHDASRSVLIEDGRGAFTQREFNTHFFSLCAVQVLTGSGDIALVAVPEGKSDADFGNSFPADGSVNALELLPEVLGARPKLEIRSEEHTSELQSRLHLVCRLLLEKKKY